jgi:hypothetical protein
MSGDTNQHEDGPAAGRTPGRKARRLSDVFARLAAEAKGQVLLSDIRDALGRRSFAPLLVLFSVFNLLPLPPGATFVLGLPLVLISAQMVYGRRDAWLPRFLARRGLTADQFRSVMNWVIPRLIRLERMIKPRYWPFWRRRGERVVGIIALVMAIVITLPIPFGNWLPAFSTTLLGLSLSERDGLLFAVGTAIGAAALAVVVVLFVTAGFAGHLFLNWLH